MTTFAVRIGRIHLRNGAELRVHDFAAQRKSEAAAALAEYRDHAETVPAGCPDMVGYVQIAWDRNGGWAMGYKTSTRSPLHEEDLARFVADRLRAATTERATLRTLSGPSRT